jgi:HPt (histidine-containing phosphotransfer) domain-containing protein
MSDEILDEEELLEEYEDDMETLARACEIFARDCDQRLPRLREAIDASDSATVNSEAHALKGGVGTFFATAAYETAYKLETMGANGELSEAAATFQTLEGELKSLRQKLDELINS